jgi:polyphosphate kinase
MSVPRTLPDGGLVLIGSADMMTRNLDRRVEAVVPVVEPHLAARVREILDVELADDRLAWELHGDGTWHKTPATTGFDAHRWFQHQAHDRGRRRLDLEPLIPAEGHG